MAGVGRTAGGWLGKSGGDLRRLLIGSGCGVLLDGGSELIEFAVVLAVFGRDAFGNRLGAFKLCAGIEEAALFAAVEFGVAFGAGAGGVEAGDQDGATIGATGAGNGADHARSARAEMIVLAARAALRRLALRTRFLFFVGIAVTAMTVLTIHKNLRTPA